MATVAARGKSIIELPLRPAHLKRYKDLVRLVIKYSDAPIVRMAGVGPAADPRGIETDEKEKAEALARDLEGMGPTFVKLGQLLSTRPDLLPPVYLDALARLQESVKPFAFEEAQAVIEEDLGIKISRAFQSFDPKPVAAASLGQVHVATLRDGRAVAVKVQRPGVRETIQLDMEVLEEVAALADEFTDAGKKYSFSVLLTEFKRALTSELDYNQEAENLASLGASLEKFESILVPSPVPDFTSSRVLTMDLVKGRSLGAISTLALQEVDGKKLLDDLFEAYIEQALVNGLLHADPHPGNVFLTDDGRIALIDVGMVLHLSDGMRKNLLRLLVAMSESNDREVVKMAEAMGTPVLRYDRKGLERDIGEMLGFARDAQLERIPMGRLIMGVAHLAGEHGLKPPPELALIGKTMLNLDGVAEKLDPDFDVNAALKKHSTSLTRHRLLDSVKPAAALGAMIDAKDFMQELPSRLGRVLDAVAESELEVRVRVVDDARLLTAVHQAANRVTMGLVLAAMIVGAALIMNIETRLTIMGYPVLAILFFLAAAVAGGALLFSIWKGDRKAEKERERR